MKTGELLRKIKRPLEAEYGERLQGVILYGSEARGEAGPLSDVDFLVLLKGQVKYGEELRKIIGALYPLQLEVIRPLHGIPVNHESYEAGEYALYRKAKAEGIAA